eukprot:1619632-Pyramimonas_sp.AAC.1
MSIVIGNIDLRLHRWTEAREPKGPSRRPGGGPGAHRPGGEPGPKPSPRDAGAANPAVDDRGDPGRNQVAGRAPTRVQKHTAHALAATSLVYGIQVCAAHQKNEARQGAA